MQNPTLLLASQGVFLCPFSRSSIDDWDSLALLAFPGGGVASNNAKPNPAPSVAGCFFVPFQSLKQAWLLAGHKKTRLCRVFSCLAERGGFEPPIPLRVYKLSRLAHSTTLTPLLVLKRAQR